MSNEALATNGKLADYYIDGVPVTWQGLIRAAKEYGYTSDGFYQTSVAARILRENGCRVSDSPNKETPHEE